jgi:hypothetical protein
MKDQGQWENRALEILDKASKKNPKLTANDREDLANYFNTMKGLTTKEKRCYDGLLDKVNKRRRLTRADLVSLEAGTPGDYTTRDPAPINTPLDGNPAVRAAEVAIRGTIVSARKSMETVDDILQLVNHLSQVAVSHITVPFFSLSFLFRC